MNTLPNVVLVHGAWADGSSWSAVVERLQAHGYDVTAPQFPLTSLADDIGRLRQVLTLQDGPTIVAGHSYGGQIITALGADAPNVVGLDEGESLGALLSQGPTPPALVHQFVDGRGFAWLSEDDVVYHFARRDLDDGCTPSSPRQQPKPPVLELDDVPSSPLAQPRPPVRRDSFCRVWRGPATLDQLAGNP